MRTQVHLLPGGRLHFHDGPIDLIVEAFGKRNAINHAYQAASARFITVLDELCRELPLLRQPPVDPPKGQIARSMYAAVLPYAQNTFITPMAAVAGAVADEVLRYMTTAANLTRAYVNNGGDIALHLAPGESFTIGLIDNPGQPSLFGTNTLHHHQPTRGIATSGRRGRSFSLGIADAVTVLAATAGQADAAATIIANAVDLPGHPNITRVPANSLAPDTDLGPRPVTQAVGQLTGEEISRALEAGAIVARQLLSRGLIHSAALNLSGENQTVGTTHTHVGAGALAWPPEKLSA
jgi:ApbE superfamily uncharacterized protein (UPF0280 family)